MKARQYAGVAALTLASFALGLTWARNWPTAIALLIGCVVMTLTMGLLSGAKREDWMRWHHREIDRVRVESLQRGRQLCQRIGGNGDGRL